MRHRCDPPSPGKPAGQLPRPATPSPQRIAPTRCGASPDRRSRRTANGHTVHSPAAG